MTEPQNETASIPGPAEPVELNIDEATLECLSVAQERYGNLVRFTSENGGTSVFVNDPTIIQQVLIKEHRRYGKGRDFERVKMLLGNGIIVSDGDVWRRHRRMMQPTFTRKRIDPLVNCVTDALQNVETQWVQVANAGANLDLTAATNQFALETILRAIFGADYNQYFADSNENPFAFLSQEFARDLRAVTRLRAVRELVKEIIDKRRASGVRSDDFLSGLLLATDKDGQGFSEREVIDEVMTLVVAGFETTAGTLNWAWFEISRNSDIEQALLEEFAACANLSAEALPELPVSRAVLDETLRLYPPVWLYSRQATESDVFAGAVVEKGTHIYLSPYLLHRNPRYWDDPDQFIPTRFIHSSELIDKASYIPFSLGPRRCIGEYFSFMEMQLALKYLLPKFELRPVDPTDQALDLGINLRSRNAILMTIKQREDVNL